jgi:uncharacterized protein (DUF302 family)
MDIETPISFGRRLAGSPATTRAAVEAALRAEGFGILTEIDVAATLKAKLGVDREPFLILGACNPALADRALAAEPSLGTLLPCNVVLRAAGGDTTIVEVMDPGAALTLVPGDAVAEIATEARARLRRAMASLEAPI